MPTILHIDINSYFATMLQQKYPSLRGKPIGVVKDQGRYCIIAVSKEAKTLGVKTGSNVPEAKKLVPRLLLVPAEFDLYLDATKKLKVLFESVSPDVQIFSLDEAFIDITRCRSYLYPSAFHLAKEIQAQIKTRLGEWVTCNIGISHNHFLSKLASEVSPKGSVTEINRSNLDYYLAQADFNSVCGIGSRLERKLRSLGITNLYALNFIDQATLVHYFGPFWSQQLRVMARGEDPHLFSLIDHNPFMKSVGRSITGFRLCDDEIQIKAILYNLATEVVYKVRKMGLAGRQVHIALFGSNRIGSNRIWHRHLTLNHYICHLDEMFDYLYHHLYLSWHRSFPIIKFAVSLSLLQPITQLSLSLLPQWHKTEKVSLALDHLSKKFGLFTVKSALLCQIPIIRPEVTGFLGDKKFQFMN